jgi:hypothetical protein
MTVLPFDRDPRLLGAFLALAVTAAAVVMGLALRRLIGRYLLEAAMSRKNLTALAEAVNDALVRAAAWATGREDDVRARLAVAEAERDRLVDAIASGGDSFAAVRDRLAAVEGEITTSTADLERARFEKRAAQVPTTMSGADLRAYLRGLRRTVKNDVPAAKAAIAGLFDGDLVLTPQTATDPPRVTGRMDPARLATVCLSALRG